MAMAFVVYQKPSRGTAYAFKTSKKLSLWRWRKV